MLYVFIFRFQFYYSAYILIEILIFYSYNATFSNKSVFIQHFLNITRMHVLPIVNNNIALSVYDSYVSTVFHNAHISSAKPPIHGHWRTFRYCFTSYEYFSYINSVISHSFSIAIYDAHLNTPKWFATGRHFINVL